MSGISIAVNNAAFADVFYGARVDVHIFALHMLYKTSPQLNGAIRPWVRMPIYVGTLAKIDMQEQSAVTVTGKDRNAKEKAPVVRRDTKTGAQATP